MIVNVSAAVSTRISFSAPVAPPRVNVPEPEMIADPPPFLMMPVRAEVPWDSVSELVPRLMAAPAPRLKVATEALAPRFKVPATFVKAVAPLAPREVAVAPLATRLLPDAA